MQLDFMKPFYVKPLGNVLRIAFAYQYISVFKNNERYDFCPVEGKVILFNLETKQIENLNEVFVFSKGNRFIRMPLYQMALVIGFEERLRKIVIEYTSDEIGAKDKIPTEIDSLIQDFEKMNIQHAIDLALDKRDFETAKKLVSYATE